MIIFGKTREELNHHELNDTYAYRTMLHYPYIVQVSSPYGASKEEIITLLQRAINAACNARSKHESKRRG